MTRALAAVLTAVAFSLTVSPALPAKAQAPLPFNPMPMWLRGLGKPVPPQQPPVQVVDVGDANERDLVDRALRAWHASTRQIPVFTVRFVRYDFAAAFGDSTTEGRISYVAPSLGLYEADRQLWVYDGTAIFEHDRIRKRLREYRLSETEIETPVAAAPFPFLYGPSPELMRRRFHLFPITPKDRTDQIWIEARPKSEADYGAGARAQFILQLPEHRLYAVNLIHANQVDRTTYVFTRFDVTPPDDVKSFAWEIGQHRQVPVGWEHEVIGEDLSLQPRKP